MIWGLLIPGWLKRGLAWAVAAGAVALGIFAAGMKYMAAKAKVKKMKRKADTLNEVIERKDDARKTSDDDLADRLTRRR